MKTFDWDFFMKLYTYYEANEYFQLPPQKYNNLVYLSKKITRESGFNISGQKIAKRNIIKIPYLLIPISIISIDTIADSVLFIEIAFLQARKTYEGFNCRFMNISTPRAVKSFTFCIRESVEELKSIKSYNDVIDIKASSFQKLLYNLEEAFQGYVPVTHISDKIGWAIDNKTPRFYPIWNSALSFDCKYRNISDEILYMQNPEFLRSPICDCYDNPIISAFLSDYMHHISESDLLLFSSTLFSFCRCFFACSPDYAPFSIFMFSDLSNDDVYRYVSFWVSLINCKVPYEINEEIDKATSLYQMRDLKRGVKMKKKYSDDVFASTIMNSVHVSYRDFISKDSYYSDIPLIVNSKAAKNPDMIVINDLLLSKANTCNRFPIFIRPENSTYLPSDNYFVNVEFTGTIIDIHNTDNITSVIKVFLLHLYQQFIIYLNNNVPSLRKKLMQYYNNSLRVIKKDNSISSTNLLSHYAHLLASLYLFQDYVIKSNPNMKTIAEILIEKSINYYKQSFEIKNKKGTDEKSFAYLRVFKLFLNVSINNGSITPGKNKIFQDNVIGWYNGEVNNNDIYLLPTYFDALSTYCMDAKFELAVSKKEFEKSILIPNKVLLPQYRPSNPNKNARYDIYIKFAGKKIKVIRTNPTFLKQYM